MLPSCRIAGSVILCPRAPHAPRRWRRCIEGGSSFLAADGSAVTQRAVLGDVTSWAALVWAAALGVAAALLRLGPLVGSDGIARFRPSFRTAVRRVTRARNAWGITALRRLWRRLYPSIGGRAGGVWAGPSALNIVLRELRRRGLVQLTDAAVAVNLLVLCRAFRDAGGLWPGTGEAAAPTDIAELANYARFATAAYGPWMTSLPAGKPSPLMKWAFRGARRRSADMEEICRHCGLASDDLLHYSEGGRSAFQPAWFLARDRASGTLVLAIRGSFTLSDIVTDAACEAVPFQGGTAHRGFLAAASEVRRNVDGPLQHYLQAEHTKELVICGHSLGGGCAVVLSMMLRHEQRVGSLSLAFRAAQIRCLTYGCPPSVKLGPNCTEEDIPLTLNASYRIDWVPRVQLGTVLRLLRAMGRVEALGLSAQDKLTFIASRRRPMGGVDGRGLCSSAPSPGPVGLRFWDLYEGADATDCASAGKSATYSALPACSPWSSLDVGEEDDDGILLQHVGRCIWVYDACGGLRYRAEVADPVLLATAPPALEDPLAALLDHIPLKYEAALQRILGYQSSQRRGGGEDSAGKASERSL